MCLCVRLSSATVLPLAPPVLSCVFTLRVCSAKIYATPDNARATLLQQLATVKRSLEVYIYQITDTGIANKVRRVDWQRRGTRASRTAR